ncbi:MAG: hypothetical protein H7832_07670 [Magnetococcus sp. DMHC-6]
MDALNVELLNTAQKMPDNMEKPVRDRLGLTSRTRGSVGVKNRKVGREAVKAGMAASLAVSLLTGLKLLRPMAMHPVASWLFLGLTVAHTLIYEMPVRKNQTVRGKTEIE